MHHTSNMRSTKCFPTESDNTAKEDLDSTVKGLIAISADLNGK